MMGVGFSLPPQLNLAPDKRVPSNAVRIVCIRSGDTINESWPEYTSFPPRVGDMIQSDSGTIKKIIEIIHSTDFNGTPTVTLRLGDDNTSVTPTDGGGDAEG